jgi:signal transduction histidine kinase
VDELSRRDGVILRARATAVLGASRLTWLVFAGLTCTYIAAAKLGLELPVAHGVITPVWAPTGIALAAVLVFGPRVWPAITLGAFIANATSGVSLAVAGPIAVGNTLEALTALYLLRRVGFHASLQRVKDVLAFAILAALVSTTVSATIGVTTLAVAGSPAASPYEPAWVLWWLGDATGAVLVAPLILVWATSTPKIRSGARTAEAAAVLAVLGGLSALVFLGGFWRYPYLLFPVLVWATLRFQQIGAASASFAAAAFAVAGVVSGSSTPLGDDPTTNVEVLQALITTVAISLLVLGATLSERDKAEEALQRAHENDAAALRIAQRLRSSVSLHEVLEQTVEELGRSLDVSHCLVRLPPRSDGSAPLFQWTRDGVEPITAELTPAAREIFRTGSALVVTDVQGDGRDEIREMFAKTSVRAAMGYPVVWTGRTIAALGVADTAPREWGSALPLLEAVAPQIATAVVQAELFERQQETIETLEQVNRMRDELIATVSHELRTPLTSTIGFLTTLKDRVGEFSREQQEFVDVALKEAAHLARLVDDLLTFTRLKHGTFELHFAPVNAGVVIERAIGRVALPPGRAIDREIATDLFLEADEDRLVQVVSNLLENALLHGGGRVSVTAAKTDGEVRLSVSDEGAGVPRQHAERLFVPFSRWSGSEGTGLGLAISRAIVEAHGGSLTYRLGSNAGPHAFVVRLPLGRRAGESPAADGDASLLDGRAAAPASEPSQARRP